MQRFIHSALLLAVIVTATSAAIPQAASAVSFSGSLVSCGNSIEITSCDAGGGREGKLIKGECSFCDVVKVMQNIINFLVFAGVIVATLLFCWAGILYLFSAPSAGNIGKAHSIFWNVLIGLVIMLSSWLIIDTVMKILYDDQGGSPLKQHLAQPWQSLVCPSETQATCQAIETQRTIEVDLTFVAERAKVVTTTRFTAASDLPSTPGQWGSAYGASAAYDAQVQQIASKYGIDPDYVRAMMMVESRGNPNASSGIGYGLLQFTVPTAKDLDPSLRGASNEQVIAKLKDPSYNLQLTDKFLAQLAPKVAGNGVILAAAWNGGAGAISKSADCPGQMKFECNINPGKLTETQKHVTRVSSAYDFIKKQKSGTGS